MPTPVVTSGLVYLPNPLPYPKGDDTLEEDIKQVVDSLPELQPTTDASKLTTGILDEARLPVSIVKESTLAPVAKSGNYADLLGKPTVPTNTSQLTNNSGFVTASTAPVTQVAGKTGAVTLSKTDVGLGNVANLVPADLPVSSAAQAILDVKPTVLGTIANLTSFVRGAVSTVQVQDLNRGGMFVYQAASAGLTVDNGVVFSATGGGYWVRKSDSSVIPVTWFGAVGGTVNDTAAFQAGMDYLWLKGGGTLFIPYKSAGYSITKLLLRNRVSIIGESIDLKIKALPSSETGLFVLGDAPVAYTNYESFTLVGNPANINQHGFDITAIPQTIPAYTGGLWFSTFTKLFISGFQGDQFHFYCADIQPPANNAGDMANQFLTFKDVIAHRYDNDTSTCIYAEGQFGQVQFIGNCQFDGTNPDKGTCIKLISRPGSSNGTDNVYTVNFVGTTMQTAKLGVYTFNVQGVSFFNCHHENLRGVYHINATSYVTIDGGTSAVGCGIDSGNGFFLKNSNSYATLSNSNVGGEDKTVINDGGITIGDGWYGPSAISFSGTTKQLQSSAGVLTSGNETKILLDTGGVENVSLTTINGRLGPDSTLTCRVWAGGSFKITTAGNISLPDWMNGSLIVRRNDVLVFKHMDLPDHWVLVSYTKNDLIKSYNNNLFYGKDAGNWNVTGGGNVALGNSTANDLSTGETNVIVGHNAGSGSKWSNKNNNVFIGAYAGNGATGGANGVIAIGFNAIDGVTPKDSSTYLTNLYFKYPSSTVDPTSSDLINGQTVLWKNTTTGVTKWFINDNGTIKSGPAFS